MGAQAMIWWLAIAMAAEPARFALLVGANAGGPGRAELRYAVDDAGAMREVLVELGGVEPDRARLLEEPTRAELREALAWLGTEVEAAGPQSTAVVYYSGHSDPTGLQLGLETYGYDTLRADLESVDARLVLTVLDGCSSGAMVRAKGGSAAPAFVEGLAAVEGRALLTSSSADEVSQEADHIGSSYFTHALVSGLRGAADYDGDGRVTLREVHAFAADETLARTVRTRLGAQHPAYDLELTGTGDFVLTDFSAVDTRLVLGESLRGRVYLRDGQGRNRAELFKSSGRSVSLGLPSGPYALVLADDGQLFEGRVRLEAGEVVTLEAAHLLPVDGEVTLARGRLYARVPVAVAFMPYPTSEGLDARDQLHHVSLGVLAVYAAQLQGLGIGTLATTYAHGADGLQIAAVYNHAGGRSRAVQITTGVNVAANRQEGVQLGLVNLAGRNRGLQLGVVNGSGENEGLSVGVVHASRTSKGPVLALLPLVGDGMRHGEVWASTQSPLNLGLKLGTNSVYTAYTVGFNPVDGRALVGLGFGGRLRPGAWQLDLDALGAVGGTADLPVLAPGVRAALARPLAGDQIAPMLLVGLGLEIPLDPGKQGTVAWLGRVGRGAVSVAPQAGLGWRFF